MQNLHRSRKKPKNRKKIDNISLLGYNTPKQKGNEQESTPIDAFSESRLVRGDTAEAAEHGLGAEESIGRLLRVRPLKRFEAEQSAKQGGTASKFRRPCMVKGGVYFFRRIL